MKGLVTIDLNERQQSPGVNAPISKFYSSGDTVDVVEAVHGDPYDGDDIWYKLKDGSFVWSGGVELEVDGATLSAEDKDQFLISYRKRHSDGRINLGTKDEPTALFFAPIRLPAASESIRVNDLVPKAFAKSVTQSVLKLSKQRKHVIIYIHGYQMFASLKLGLFTSFVQNYMTHPQNNIAKALFMVWPAQGLSRKKADDRAIIAGEQFTINDLFAGFRELSKELGENKKCLNLVVHSFGHQLLNGMLNPGDGHEPKIPKDVFENIFLMAPDITHMSTSNTGIELENFYSAGRSNFFYDLRKLTSLSKNVHVFHDHHDYLLYTSTKKFVGKDRVGNPPITDSYRNLGNYGPSLLGPNQCAPGFTFHDVESLVENGDSLDLLNYPFRGISDKAKREIEEVLKTTNYTNIKDIRVILNLQRFPNHHRYLFTCKPVVNEVQRLLSDNP